MIRALRERDLDAVMEIWLAANRQAHAFISKSYWESHFALVRELLPKAEVFVYEEEGSPSICGFLGLTDDYIAGIFVREASRSKGIGKRLLDHAKSVRPRLSLSVYQKNARAVAFYQREGFALQSEHVEESTGEKELFLVWEKGAKP